MKLIFKSNIIFLLLSFSSFLSVAQINTDRVMNIGRNALYFEDYILSMQSSDKGKAVYGRALFL